MTTEQKFDCVFCQEAFEDKESLQIHFRKHGDPKFDQISKIGKNRVQNEVAPADKNEDIEMVGCDVCEEVFPTISKAITHKHKAHPDHEAKHFCPFCGKLFTMKHLHNKHIQSNHASEEEISSRDFHCDLCDVTFNAPSALLYHNKFFHRQDTEFIVIGNSKKVKMYNQEMLQIYYCPFCGEEYNNKVNLHKHINDDHCDENQRPSEVLRCPLCEAVFYHLDAYEIHLTFHSSDDVYNEKTGPIEQVTEFSLETVAPIMENIMEEDQAMLPEDDNTVSNSDDIANFLQLVMGDQEDSAGIERVKHKKHKKHKKSKKAAITLDEFLNMNKDVFGDGLGDIQGIEEVPTQAVLKKAKVKTQSRNESKMINADLAKLKRQGIIVKSKPKNNAIVGRAHAKAHNISSSSQIVKNKVNALQKSPDILTKLLKQGNSQIKIVKKPSQNINEDNTEYINSEEVDNPCEQPNMMVQSKELENKETSNVETSSVTENIDSYSTLTNTIGEVANENCLDLNGKAAPDETHEENHSKLEHIKTNVLDNNVPNPNHDETENHIKLKNLLNTQSSKSEGQNCDLQNKESETNKTLNVLKHLSHLITIKPLVSQNKEPTKMDIGQDNNSNIPTTENNEQRSLMNKLLNSGQTTVKLPKLSPLNKPPIAQSDPDSGEEYSDDPDKLFRDSKLPLKDAITKQTNIEKKLNKDNIQMLDVMVKKEPLSQSASNSFSTNNTYVDHLNDLSPTHIKSEHIIPKETSNLDILRRLPNVTAKPVNAANHQGNLKPHARIGPQIKTLMPKKLDKGIDDKLEVYNIDDSDDDIGEEARSYETDMKEFSKPSLDTMKNLPKNISVNSNENKIASNLIKNIKLQSNKMQTNSYSETYTRIKQSKEIQKSLNLQNKLKSLGNITVKSRNSSPIYSKKDQIEDFDDCDEEQEHNSESDNENTNRVKITEVEDDYMSDHDFDDIPQEGVVESPHPSNSETEDNHEDFDDDLPDFENHIKANTVKKIEVPTKTHVPNLETIKNLNKAVTIKSINTKSSEQIPTPPSDETMPDNEMAVTPYQPNLSQNDQTTNKVTANLPSPNQTFNQKLNTASNQVNTVKTVNTVKRFQSQTVIEEITTTVTKTIRTVNSSSEVMQSPSPNTPKPVGRPPKIIKPPVKDLQVPAFRPTVGTKIRNAVPLARAPNAPMIRPSSQIVPTRPVFNRPRCPTPNATAVRKFTPRCGPQRPAIGKLKISPYALNQTSKRPSDESIGHFSAFKKPKDALMTSDLQDFSDDDSSVQYSSSQSRSDFSSITKSIKGKGMVTATQTKSEVSTSSQQQISKGGITATQMRSEVSTSSQQQLSKLSNVSGLKIMKTSTKQATQVEEKCEMSPAKRNTLEALEKLQKQGLLVKKPRIEEFNDHTNSYSDSDDEFGEK